jgi:hypothetical protein
MIKYFFISNIICNFTLSNNLKLNNMKKIQLIITTVILMLSTLTIKSQTSFIGPFMYTGSGGIYKNTKDTLISLVSYGRTFTNTCTITTIPTNTITIDFDIYQDDYNSSNIYNIDTIRISNGLITDTLTCLLQSTMQKHVSFTLTPTSGTISTLTFTLNSHNQTGGLSKIKLDNIKIKVINSTAAGISNLEHSVTQLTSFPNPSNGEFKIKFHTNKVKTDVFMYDISGRLVYENLNDKEIGENTLHMNTDFASGIYIIKVENKSFLTTIIK